MKIAVRSPNWIGDGVMAIPAIRALKTALPAESLHLVSKSYLADIFLNIPGIDGIIRLPDRMGPASLLPVARSLRGHSFDMGVLLTNSFHSALLFKLAGIREIAGYNRDGRGLLLSRRIAVPPAGGHHRRYYLNLVEQIAGVRELPDLPAELALTAAENGEAKALLESLGIPESPLRLALAPTAAYGMAKCWPPERFSAFIGGWLALRPESQVLAFGSPGERQAVQGIVEKAGGATFNLAGRLTLRQSIILLAHCRLVVANDSGMMHLASALRLPLVALFGATLPQRTGPGSGRDRRVIFHPAECTPCNHRDCPIDHPCMTAIGVEEVIDACTQVLEATPGDAGR